MVRGPHARQRAALARSRFQEERARRLSSAIVNLSNMPTSRPQRDAAVAGESPLERISVNRLAGPGWRLGESLPSTWREPFSARITSLRRLRWTRCASILRLARRSCSRLSAQLRERLSPSTGAEQASTGSPRAFEPHAGRRRAALRQAQEVIDRLIVTVPFVFLFALARRLVRTRRGRDRTTRRREPPCARTLLAAHWRAASARFLAMGCSPPARHARAAASAGSRAALFDSPAARALRCGSPGRSPASPAFAQRVLSCKVLRSSPALSFAIRCNLAAC